MSAVFIALEGLDGSGQSTQCKFLKDWFFNQAKKCLVTKEPTGNLVGGLIRAQLTGMWQSSAEALQLLFAADRALHLEKEISPALKNGIHVVSDRYLFSSIAYGMLDADKHWLQNINSTFLLPDAIIYLDVKPEECLRRLEGDRVGLELFEKKDLLTKVRANYLELSREYKGFHVVDGMRSPAVVHEEILNIIKNCL
ncbi:dTMP kinase [archaeon]|nr:dTMP kinase [archaeon]